ncbi:hypothetical protein DFH06DRAFT_1327894 [Mycena polygramma]|nr:hypothetical protein DFH06DRAFT_1327894 [Mycena polygramma]
MPPLRRDPTPLTGPEVIPIRTQVVARRGHLGRRTPQVPPEFHRASAAGRDPNLPPWAMDSRPNSLQDYGGQWWDCPGWAGNGWGNYANYDDSPGWVSLGWAENTSPWPHPSDSETPVDTPASSPSTDTGHGWGWGDTDGGWGPGGWPEPDASEVDTPASSSSTDTGSGWGGGAGWGAAWPDASNLPAPSPPSGADAHTPSSSSSPPSPSSSPPSPSSSSLSSLSLASHVESSS